MEISSINSNAQIMAEFYAQQDSADEALEQSIAQQLDGLNVQPPQMDGSNIQSNQ
jgi:hypothetical protein